MSTPHEKKNPSKRGAHKAETYARWKKELQGIHKFTFSTRKHFTPQQKSAITRAHRKYEHLIIERNKIARGRPGKKFRIVPLTRTEREALKDRFEMTNLGAVVYGNVKNVKPIKKRKAKKVLERLAKKKKRKPTVFDNLARIIFELYTLDELLFLQPEDIADEILERYGVEVDISDIEEITRQAILEKKFSGLKNRVIVKQRIGRRREVFIPLLEGEKIDDLIDYVWQKLNPQYVMLSVGKSRGLQTMDKGAWEGYRETLLQIDQKIGDWQKERGKLEESPFNGVYAVWFV